MIKKLAIISLILTALFVAENKNRAEASVGIGINVFFDALSPYGEWVSVPTYGNVWYPTNVGPSWRPYTNGHWVWSNYGWTWVSYEPWGWAPYHYGRWVFLDYYRWVWIPGTVWAPAWVTWYESPEYIGWAPLPPDNNFFLQEGIGFNNYNYYTPASHCVFVPSHKFLHHNVHSFAVPRSHNVKIIKNTTHINNIRIANNNVINRGPDVGFVERVSRTKVKKVNLVERDIDTNRVIKSRANVNKLEGRNYHVFRPDIVRNDNDSTLSNWSPKKKKLQIEDREKNPYKQDNIQNVTGRKHYEPRKEHSTNNVKTRDKKESIYSNHKTVIKNGDEFEKRDNFVNPSEKEYRLNRGIKKRNLNDIENNNGSPYRNTRLEKGSELDKNRGSKQYRALENSTGKAKKAIDSDKRVYNKITPRYNESSGYNREEKSRKRSFKSQSNIEKRDINPHSTQKSKKSNGHKNSRGEVRAL
jgi:hypothetical protein